MVLIQTTGNKTGPQLQMDDSKEKLVRRVHQLAGAPVHQFDPLVQLCSLGSH